MTEIECVKHRGAKAFRPLPYCLPHAIGLKYHFLNSGTLVVVDQRRLEEKLASKSPIVQAVR
jgi:hypothetical protein